MIITKKRRTVACSIACLVILWTITALVPVQAASTTVVGSDDPSVDVPAVQFAVDNYDEVILKGTFDFGTPPPENPLEPGHSVYITTDVTISGDEAVIRHGRIPFWVDNPGGTVEVSGIYFEEPAAITLYTDAPLARMVLRDNTISMSGSEVYWGVYITSQEAVIESNTIDITAAWVWAAGIWFEQWGLTPGSSKVSGNHLTCFNSDGIKCNYVENVDIVGNRVYVDATLGHTSWETILLRGSHSRMTHNEVGGPASPVSGTTLAGPTVAAGADNYVAYNKGFGFLTEGIKLDACDDSVFEHNTFDDICGVGIAAFSGSDRNTFKSNKFANIIGVQYWLAEYAGIPYSWGILLSGVDNVVSNNKLSGEADYGVAILNDIRKPGVSSGNTFRGNNLATMDAGTATYWCGPGTLNNAVIGYSGTVIDEGAGNSFRGK